jgi:hypothetical protein
MQLPEDLILATEYAIPLAICIVLAAGYIVKKRLVRVTVFVLSAAQIILVSLRPAEYNSDTRAYSGYLHVLADAKGTELLFLTKFEPLHLLLAVVAENLRVWLLLEALIGMWLVWELIRRTERPETLAVVLGTTLPLMSSSVRFAISLLAISWVLLVFHGNRSKFIALSAIGGMTHVSMAVSGLIERRRWVLTWLLLGAFFAVAYAVSSILLRAGVSENARPTGTRTFVCLLSLLIYLRAVLPSYRPRFRSDVLSALGIFALSALFFPLVNRWLVLLLIVVAVQSDEGLDRARVPRRIGSLFAFFLYCMLLVPFLYSMARLVIAGEWFV